MAAPLSHSSQTSSSGLEELQPVPGPLGVSTFAASAITYGGVLLGTLIGPYLDKRVGVTVCISG